MPSTLVGRSYEQSAQLNMQVSPEQLEAIRAAARAEGLTIRQFVLQRALSGVTVSPQSSAAAEVVKKSRNVR